MQILKTRKKEIRNMNLKKNTLNQLYIHLCLLKMVFGTWTASHNTENFYYFCGNIQKNYIEKAIVTFTF